MTTPAVVLVKDKQVVRAWEAKAPDLDEIMQILANYENSNSYVKRQL